MVGWACLLVFLLTKNYGSLKSIFYLDHLQVHTQHLAGTLQAVMCLMRRCVFDKPYAGMSHSVVGCEFSVNELTI